MGSLHWMGVYAADAGGGCRRRMPAADAGGGANGGVKIGCNRLGPRAVGWIWAGLVWLSTDLATALTGLALGLTLGFSSAGGDAAYLLTGVTFEEKISQLQ